MGGEVNWSFHELRLEMLERQSVRRGDESRVREVYSRFERLELVCRAMWELAKAREGLSDAELGRMVVEVDLKDGVMDGKRRREPIECGGCGRRNGMGHTRCMYCGEMLARRPFG